jgi:hypothetical protein
MDQLGEPTANRDKNDIEALIRRFNKDRAHGRVSLKDFI